MGNILKINFSKDAKKVKKWCCIVSLIIRQYSSEYFSFNRWGRWKDILSHGKFKKMLEEKDVENISRALVITVYLLRVSSFFLKIEI